MSEIVLELEKLRGRAQREAVEALIERAQGEGSGAEGSLWRHLMRARDPKLRRAVAEGLVGLLEAAAEGEREPVGVLEACLVALDDPDRRVRESAFEALTKLEVRAVDRELLRALAEHVEAEVVQSLLVASEEASLEVLTELLRDRSAERRAIAARLLGEIGGAEAADRLLFGVDDPDSGVRAAVLEALSEQEPTEEAASLLVPWVEDEQARALLIAHGALAQGPLEAALSDRDARARRASVEALAELGREHELSVTETLARSLDDPSRSVRRAVLEALSTLPQADAVPAALAMVFKEEAAQTLMLGYGERALRPLMGLLGEGTKREREYASAVLLGLDTEAVPRERLAAVVVPHVEDSNEAAQTVEALGADALPALLERLDEDEAPLKTLLPLVEAAGALEEPSRRSELATRLVQHVEDSRAVELLEALGDASVPALEAALEAAEEPSRRRKLVGLLGNLGAGGAAVPLLLDALEDATTKRTRSAALSALEDAELGGEELTRLSQHVGDSGVDALLVEQGDAGVAALMPQLEAEDAVMRRAALSALAGFPAEQAAAALPALAQRVRQEEESRVQRELYRRLEALDRHPDLAQALATQVTDRRARTLLLAYEEAAVAPLVAELEREDAAHRKAAIRCLTMLGPDVAQAAVEPLTQALDDPDKGVHQAALEALAELNAEGEEVVVALARHIHSRGAVEQLLEQGPQAVPALVSLLDAEESRTREVALSSLASLGMDASDALGAVNVALDDLERSVRRAALRAAEALSPSPDQLISLLVPRLDDKIAREAVVERGALAVDALTEVLEGHDDPEMRKRAIQALADLGEAAAPALPHVVARLEDEEDSVQRAALKALESLPQDAACVLPALVPFATRKRARRLIVAYGEAAVDSCLAMLDDDNARTRKLAVRMLREIGTDKERVVSALRAALEDSTASVRRAAMAALGELAPEVEALPEVAARQLPNAKAREILEAAGLEALPHLTLAVGVKKSRLDAIQLIGRLGHAALEASSVVRPHIHDRDPALRLAAFETLLSIHEQRRKQLLPVLFAALEDDSPDVESLARKSLRDLGVDVPKTTWERCPLDNKVVKQLRRLGVSYDPLDEPEPTEIMDKPVPEPMRTLFDDMAWPPRSFYSPKGNRGEDMVLGFSDPVEPGELGITDRDDRTLILFGHANGGEALLITALEVTKPSDPTIYTIDAELDIQTLGRGVRLSTMLSDLEPEEQG